MQYFDSIVIWRSLIKFNTKSLLCTLPAAMPRSVGQSDVATMTGAAALSLNDDQVVCQQHSTAPVQELKKTPPKTLRMDNLSFTTH